jgi:hypothetical protein
MAQQSARLGRKNQMNPSCLEHAFMTWFRSVNSHTGPQLHRCIRGRTDGSIRLRAIFFKNRLHLAGRPQMSTRPSPLLDFAAWNTQYPWPGGQLAPTRPNPELCRARWTAYG